MKRVSSLGFDKHCARPYLAAALTRLALATAISAALTITAKAGGSLFIYTWSDYTAPALIAKFEKETGIKVTIDTFNSNEMLLAKLKAGSTGYDIIIGSSDFIPIFIDEHLLQKVEASTWPDYKNIDSRWRSPAWDKGNAYTIPFGWGVTSYVVNTKFITAPADSLKLLFEPPPEAKGKVGMMGAPTEVTSMAEVYLGLSPCQTDVGVMKTVAALLKAQAPSVKVYASDGVVERAASGETWIQQTWNGDAARARAANPDLRFIFPKEGAIAWMDNVAMPVGARNPDNAKLFMRFLLRPENAALSANFTHAESPIAGVDPYLDEVMRTAPEYKVPPDLKITFAPSCPAKAIQLIDRVWTQLRR